MARPDCTRETAQTYRSPGRRHARLTYLRRLSRLERKAGGARRSPFQNVVHGLTHAEHRAWVAAGYPGLDDRDPKKLLALVSPLRRPILQRRAA